MSEDWKNEDTYAVKLKRRDKCAICGKSDKELQALRRVACAAKGCIAQISSSDFVHRNENTNELINAIKALEELEKK